MSTGARALACYFFGGGRGDLLPWPLGGDAMIAVWIEGMLGGMWRDVG